MKESRTNHPRRSRTNLLLADVRCPGRPRHTIKGLALLVGIVLLVLAGCGPPPDLVAEQLVEAINTQDLDGALGLFARDSVVSVGRSAPISGMGEIETWLERLFANNVELGAPEILTQDENSLLARYPLTMASTSTQGVVSLEGTGEIVIREGRITALTFSLSEGSRAELLRAMLQVGRPVLSYAVLTDPDPLRASPGGPYDPNLASLTVLVTNNTREPVPVRNIVLRLAEGSSPRDLTPNISGVNSEAPDYWHVTKKEGRFVLAPELPEDGLLEAGEGLSIVLSEIEINDKPGVWSLEIVEETGEATRGSLTIQLAKFPFALYVSDLAAEPLVVESGGSTALSWEGSDGATYSLYDGHATMVVPSVGSHPVDDLTLTTTFYLTATLVGAEDQLPVIRERTVTVRPIEKTSFVASPNTVKMGDTITLTWQTQAAVRCKLWEGMVIIDPKVDCTSLAYRVRPLTTNPTNYTLKAFGEDDSLVTQRTLTVVVTDMKPTAIATIPVGEQPVAVAVSPDGARLYVANHGSQSISIIDSVKAENDPETATLATISVGEQPVAVAVSPDGARLYVAIQNGISIIDSVKAENDPENALVVTVDFGQRYPSDVVLSPDGRRIYVTDYLADYVEPSLSVIDADVAESDPENALMATIPMGRVSPAMAVSPDGRRIYVAQKDVIVIDAENAVGDPENALVATLGFGQRYSSGVVLSPDGRRIYVTNYLADYVGPSLSVIDAEVAESDPENALMATIPMEEQPVAVAVSPDGATLFVAIENGNNVFVIDAGKAVNDPENALVATIPVEQGSSALTISPDGHRLYVANLDNNTVSVIAIPED